MIGELTVCKAYMWTMHYTCERAVVINGRDPQVAV